ncbi:hypothetical protein [Pseudoclavibacter sp. CFCC 11306]|uniref:hypothetical protein n=1 Tax=Pseudoclavibacter sp. CFCC 11306 TaxID=1564493 RepID=UPI0013010FC9|nr:hypothetical protein [Pseudoclavibacter sp. CFCC 11306]KAB1656984.1 hypothetical protein F8O09_09265 [Pseudoclavibacter sp. CFCC 11306]
MVHLALTATIVRELCGDPHVEQAAWLHGLIEDHSEFHERLESEFPHLVESLAIDSRREDETYHEFIDRILASENRIAITVKPADMSSNLSNNPPQYLRNRYERNIGRLCMAVKL